MSETTLKGSPASSPSPSPPPTFPRLGSRSKSIAKQYDAALALASTAYSSVDDLYKNTWGQRRFVIASLLDRRRSRGRRSWIGNHGWFLAELKRDNTSSGNIWCYRLCNDRARLIKQSELNSFIQELGLEADASRRVPTADILTSDDWRVLREVSHILELIYNMTMRTQG